MENFLLEFTQHQLLKSLFFYGDLSVKYGRQSFLAGDILAVNDVRACPTLSDLARYKAMRSLRPVPV